ncbi:MAG: HPr family phosphocarrier protein [Planctomycetaceae bacterium]|nr:HPr family phosphocarrier protein [Planctomycetaceae bacterium]
MTSETTSQREVTVNLENGLHMVPCSRIAEHVRDFVGEVSIHVEDRSVDAKSIFDLLTLRAPFGTVLMIEAVGKDSEDLVNGLATLFERNFEPE